MLGSLRFRLTATDRRAAEAAADGDRREGARGDAVAFAALYDRYADPVYRFCYRRLGDASAAEDATSQVFTKALAALPRFRGGSQRAWLFAIAANVVVDAYRERSSAVPIEAATEIPDATPGPEQHSIAAERRQAVRTALADLPETQRRIVELRLAGLTGPEIAAALGLSLAAVKSAQSRAYARLRHLLGVAIGDEEAAR